MTLDSATYTPIALPLRLRMQLLHDIEQMRRAWTEMGKALGMKSVAVSDPESYGKKKTALDRLRHKHLTFWIISAMMTVGGFLIFSRTLIVEPDLSLWLGAAYAFYFLTAASMDFYLWRGIGSIDPLGMDVSEISAKSMFYRKSHLQFMTILIPMAIALLGFTGYVYSSEIYFLNGMVAGVIAGAIIGTIQFRRFMAEYRHLS